MATHNELWQPPAKGPLSKKGHDVHHPASDIMGAGAAAFLIGQMIKQNSWVIGGTHGTATSQFTDISTGTGAAAAVDSIDGNLVKYTCGSTSTFLGGVRGTSGVAVTAANTPG